VAYSKRLLLLIVSCTLLRILLAGMVEFGNDEVYYYTYALHLQPNYFDHPPGVAVLIKLFTLNLTFTSIIFVRLGAIVCAAMATWLCFAIGKLLRNERTGWLAAVLYNTSLYSCIIAGTFILPDSPQVVCWLAALFILLRIVLVLKDGYHFSYLHWVLFGVFSGLCIMCKVHGVFLWIGLGGYIFLFNRGMLLHPGVYIALVIAALIASPVLIWNLHNNFITWRFHSDRVAVHSTAINAVGFVQAVAGQLLYNNPVNVVIIAAGVTWCCRKKLPLKHGGKLLLCMGLPIIIVVSGIALWRDVLPHWSGPGFITLSFLGAAWLDELLTLKTARMARALLLSAIVLIILAVAGGVIMINCYPGTPGKTLNANYGEDDFTLDLYGWQAFGVAFRDWEKQAVAAQKLPAGLSVVCNKWFPAAHIDYYVTRQTNTHVVGVGLLTNLHHYAWLNHFRGGLNKGADALCIVPGNYPVDMQQAYGNYFDCIVPLKTFVSMRNKKIARYFRVYWLKSYRANDEVHNVIVK